MGVGPVLCPPLLGSVPPGGAVRVHGWPPSSVPLPLLFLTRRERSGLGRTGGGGWGSGERYFSPGARSLPGLFCHHLRSPRPRPSMFLQVALHRSRLGAGPLHLSGPSPLLEGGSRRLGPPPLPAATSHGAPHLSRTSVPVSGCRFPFLHLVCSYCPHWNQSVPQNVMFEFSDWCLKTSILRHLALVRDSCIIWVHNVLVL